MPVGGGLECVVVGGGVVWVGVVVGVTGRVTGVTGRLTTGAATVVLRRTGATGAVDATATRGGWAARAWRTVR